MYSSTQEGSSLLCRPVSGVLGTNIESREWRRCDCEIPEHPRASTTDDAECLFSILRDMVGKHFTLQTVNWIPHCPTTITPADVLGKSKRNPRSQRTGRITLSKPGERSTRNTFHNVPVDHITNSYS